ncbi:hypothetical protein BDF14DRAFT_1775491 [Spinellus fusiger]|nr:hypothetical protein BDF14DRAFT_1775491 [Spinellus fusiger]
MESHTKIFDNLEAEFVSLDQQYNQGELRVFGSNTERIFRELDVIRRKQIELTSDHIALEAINDSLSQNTTSSKNEAGAQDEYQREAENFNKKKTALNSLMTKLDSLRVSM